jgi:tetratricopeptide (TPR) repeat protein
MFSRLLKRFLILAFFLCTVFLLDVVLAQRPTPSPVPAGRGSATLNGEDSTIDIDIYVRGADGAPIGVAAVVTLVIMTGQVVAEGTTRGGNIKFSRVAASAYTIQVAAPGYENGVKELDADSAGVAQVFIDMQPAKGETRTASSGIVLAPKAQRELEKALEALRRKKPAEARSHLDTAYRKAPNHPGVNYLYGVYFLQMKDRESAKSYWTKTLELDPKHVSALLALSETLVHEEKLADAEAYGKRAVEADPSSWRTHEILAKVYLREHSLDAAAQEAERALELGHGQAAHVQPLLAQALAENGNKDRAKNVLQTYVKEHPADAAAQTQLADLMSSPAEVVRTAKAVDIANNHAPATETNITLPLASSWLPSDIDEEVPPVEPGKACKLDEVLQKAGKRVQEFIKNVDRYTATEVLTHQAIDKWGLAASPETRKFNYVASFEELRPGYFNVMEYRTGMRSLKELPGGIATNGLPALVLIFHPNEAGNFEMTCEGLGHWSGGLAWQVHFRQRPDKPNNMREYRIGEGGPGYPVGLRGRAWISADSYEIVRMETDLVAPVPEIRLVADHIAVAYGPVRFRNRNVEMWLPQSAEVYCDWRGRRMHRRLSFRDYLLFSVDEKQRISEPKAEAEIQPVN